MMWRPARPLDVYLMAPVGMFGGLVWQFLAHMMAAQVADKWTLDTPHGPAVLIWTFQSDDGRTKVGAVIGTAARKAPVRVRRAVREWLDLHAVNAYADPEDGHPSFIRTLGFVGFTRVGDTWRWLG